MTSNNFLIGPIKDGSRKDLKPWAIPEDSFEELVNAYQFRGRILKRSGYTLLGRLSHQVTSQIVAASAQNFTNNLFTTFTLTGVTIVPETMRITVNGAGNYVLDDSSNTPGTIQKISGAGAAFLNGTIDYKTGDLALNFSANPGGNVVITFSYAYNLPVMGLRTRELFELNEQDLVAFDTVYSYRYSNTNDQFNPLASVMPTIWSGTDYQFFFTTNYAGAFWATNSKPGLHGWNITAFAGQAGVGNLATVNVTSAGNNVQVGDYVYFLNLSANVQANAAVLAIVTLAGNPFTVMATNLTSTSTFVWTDGVTTSGMVVDSMQSITGQDGIRYYGDLTNGLGWANYNPPVDLTTALVGCLLIFPYRGYLVFLNTTEGNELGVSNFGNRARWSQIGTPYYSEPVPTTPNQQTIDIKAARDDLFGRGGANDAPTQEVIIGAAFIRDILVVFFERSTWRLRFVNNAQNPFVWERVNVELGASATFSTIPFDKGLMAIGERGIVISDSNDTYRIDEKIPDTVFNFRIQNQGMQRIQGIRTFKTKLNFWSYASQTYPNAIFPDFVLVYNYDTKNWSVFDDCFTSFGYFYAFNDTTWGDLVEAWSSYDNITWQSGIPEQGFETIVAGNQQGFVFKLEQTSGQNDPSLYISAISGTTFTSPNNNLADETWIELSSIAGSTSDDGISLNGRRFKLVNPAGPGDQPNTFLLQEFTPFFGGVANGATYNLTTLAVPFIPIYPGSVNIWVGTTLNFTDTGLDGVLYDSLGVARGTINYTTGSISLTFSAPVVTQDVWIRIVSKNPLQGLATVTTTGTYTGGGYISKISNIDITSKIFNFLPQDKRSRLSKIDFYLNKTTAGQFICNVFADSSDVAVNVPLSDNSQSNVVLSTLNPYQVSNGSETIYRLFCDAVAQTLQIQLTMSDQQQAVKVICDSDIELLAMSFSIRPGGRLI